MENVIKIKTTSLMNNRQIGGPIIQKDFLKYGNIHVTYRILSDRIIVSDVCGVSPSYAVVYKFKTIDKKEIYQNKLFLERWFNDLEQSNKDLIFKNLLLNAKEFQGYL